MFPHHHLFLFFPSVGLSCGWRIMQLFRPPGVCNRGSPIRERPCLAVLCLSSASCRTGTTHLATCNPTDTPTVTLAHTTQPQARVALTKAHHHHHHHPSSANHHLTHQGTKRPRLDGQPGHPRDFQYAGGTAITTATGCGSGGDGGGRRAHGGIAGGAAGLPYDDFGGIGVDGGGGGPGYGGRMPAAVAGDVGSYPSPFDTYGGTVSGRGRGGAVGGLGVHDYFGGGGVSDGLIGDGLEEVRGGIVGGATIHNAGVEDGSCGSSRRYDYAPGSGGTSYASSVRGGSGSGSSGGSRIVGGVEAFNSGVDGGRYSGSGSGSGLHALGTGVGGAYADVRGGMVGGGRGGGGSDGGGSRGGGYGYSNTGGQGRVGRGDGASGLAYDEYGADFYPVGHGGGGSAGGGGVGRVLPAAAPMSTSGGGGGGGRGSSGYGHNGGGRVVGDGGGGGLMMGAVGAGGAAVSRGRDPDRTGGDGQAHAGLGRAAGAAAVARGEAVVEEEVDKKEDDDNEEAAIADEGPLGGWTEVEAWSFSGLPLEVLFITLEVPICTHARSWTRGEMTNRLWRAEIK